LLDFKPSLSTMAFFFSHHNRPNVTLTGEERLDVTYTYFPQPDISVTRSYIGPPQPPEDAVETVTYHCHFLAYTFRRPFYDSLETILYRDRLALNHTHSIISHIDHLREIALLVQRRRDVLRQLPDGELKALWRDETGLLFCRLAKDYLEVLNNLVRTAFGD
ncbi:MAG: hypothetical protein LQ346_004486, partial [Caloplaca aetnensis]